MENEKWGELREEIEHIKKEERPSFLRLAKIIEKDVLANDPASLYYVIDKFLEDKTLLETWEIVEKAIGRIRTGKACRERAEADVCREFFANALELEQYYEERSYHLTRTFLKNMVMQDSSRCGLPGTSRLPSGWEEVDRYVPLVLSLVRSLDETSRIQGIRFSRRFDFDN